MFCFRNTGLFDANHRSHTSKHVMSLSKELKYSLLHSTGAREINRDADYYLSLFDINLLWIMVINFEI